MDANYDEKSDNLFRQQMAGLSLQDVLDMLEGDNFDNKIIDVRETSLGLDINMLSNPLFILSTNNLMSPPLTYVIYKDLCGNTTGNRIVFVDGGECIHYKFDGTTQVDDEDSDHKFTTKITGMLDDMCL